MSESSKKPPRPRDKRTPEEKREQDLRNSAAIRRGISYEEFYREVYGDDEDRPY